MLNLAIILASLFVLLVLLALPRRGDQDGQIIYRGVLVENRRPRTRRRNIFDEM